MKNMFLKILSGCAMLALPVLVFAENTVVQPKIMVVPKTLEGQDVREVLEADPAKRVALTEIKDYFDQQGFTTVDFLAKLKAISMGNAMNADAQTDIKTKIIQGSGADIYVDAEVIFDKKPEGNKVNLILTAYDVATANSLANKNGESRRFYTDDVSKLSQLAVKSCADDFLATLQTKFTDIVENGRTIQVQIVVNNSSSVVLSDSGPSGDPISDVIEEWMENNAYKGNYHIQGTEDKLMIFDEVRVPVRDENGNDYKLRKFRSPLASLLKSLGLNPKITTKGQSIYVELQ